MKVYARIASARSLSSYLTRGKLYEVVKECDSLFFIVDDKGVEIGCCWNECAHIGGEWERVAIPDSAMTLDARWTDDCGGKKDYDGDILSVSSRYWPGGVGLQVYGGSDAEKEEIAGIKPGATSLLVINSKEGLGQDAVLVENSFEGDTFEDIRSQVEKWAQEQMDRAVAALRAEFAKR